MNTAVLIGVMAVVTVLLRAMPFILFQKKTPKYISYLGKVLPPAIIGMLVIYCLKDVNFLAGTHGVPELLAIAITVILHLLKRNMLLSVAAGTVSYMLLIQFVF